MEMETSQELRIASGETPAHPPSPPGDGSENYAPATTTSGIDTLNADVRDMADTVPHMMWFSGPRGGVLFYNKRFAEYTGIDPHAAFGTGWSVTIHPDDLDECIKTRNEALLSEKPWKFDYRIRRHDGVYRWHVGRTLPLFDAKGVVRRWVGTATDIHEEIEAARKQRRFLREVLASVTEGRLNLCDTAADLPAPPQLPDTLAHCILSVQTLAEFRRMTNDACAVAGLPVSRAADLVLAAGEAAMNAVVHGGGGEGRVYADPVHGLVQVWVTDTGVGIAVDSLHRATLEPGYSSAGSLGQGFPLLLRWADRVFLLTGAGAGTTIVIEQGRESP